MFRRSRPDTPPALTRALRGTLAGIWAERLARAFWPFSSVVLFAAAALGFGVQDHLPPFWAGALVLVILGAALGSLLVGAWRLRVPFSADAARRLDQALPGRPLSTLADHQAIGAQDAASARVWAVHMARMQAGLAHATPVRGDLRLARFDRFGLRYIALTAFTVSVVFGAPTRVGEISDIAQISGRAEAVALGPSWEAWVQPPPYTGRPSLYLNEVDRARLDLPQGSRVTVRFYGQQGVMSVHESLSDRDAANPDDMAQDFDIERSGRLSIRGPGGRDWEVVALADQPPAVALDGVAGRERGGLMRQDFTARDDYGVVAGHVHIDIDLGNVPREFGLALPPEPRDALTMALPLPVSGSRVEFSDAFIEDFSQHAWANMPVTVALQVEDARGQHARTEAQGMTLPGRRFFDPMAAAVIELRRDLLWNRENAVRAGQLMRAIGHHPQDAFRGIEARIRFTETRDLLLASLNDGGLDGATRDDLAQRMWDLAVLLEEGELADARERLRRAQERLDEAVRSGADPSEVAELMDELRDAMRAYMRQLAEQPRERGEAPPDGESMEITQDQIQQLLDRIQELMEEGRMDEAAELLAQLQALLENLQMAEGQGGEGMPGNDAMEGLGDALREQQNLADDTFNDLQEQFRNREDGEGGAPSEQLTERQRELADQLRDQQLAPLPGEGTPEGDAALEALERAQRAMEDAAQSLEDGDTSEALNRQADAMEAMRDGLRAMNDARTQTQRAQQQQQGEQGAQGGRDPLGRDRNQGGDVGTDQDMLQGGDTYRRAQDLLDELRRRSAELDRPEVELDYLRRLLDRF
ncbi:DUF4175 domain-containing protein [Roseinatronobacter sp. NSM]|uniref:DUF4175 domain-containing protein n=1 Tax=Roseinatronobacter sp. NSM TaxID=3457785 RepID=UPI0040375C23